MVKEYYFKNRVLEQLDIHMKKSQQNKTENLNCASYQVQNELELGNRLDVKLYQILNYKTFYTEHMRASYMSSYSLMLSQNHVLYVVLSI